MPINDWIDTLCAVWEIDDGSGGTVRSYRVYEKREFPESITDIPCAISYTQGANMTIQASGGFTIWHGVTEFHLSQGIDKSIYPDIMLYFARIRAAFSGNHKLGGLVSHFKPRPDVSPQIQAPVSLQYGSEDPHIGIVIYWEVKENNSDIVIA